ncbi:MAG: hypothetical protein Q9188_005334 [Gyalolechia gomerana]
MSSQASFPDWGRIPTNHLERARKLQNGTKQTLRLLQAGITPPADCLKFALTAFEGFLERCMESPSGKLILDAITKLAENSKRRDKDIEEKVRSIKSSPPLIHYILVGQKLGIGRWGQARTEIQDRQIIVRMNNISIADENKKLEPTQIAQRINKTLTDKGMTDVNIAAAMTLTGSGDIKITAATAAEAAKLRTNREWTEVLSPTATLKVKSFGIFVKGVRTSAIKTTDMEVLKEDIREENKHTLEMDIQWVG